MAQRRPLLVMMVLAIATCWLTAPVHSITFTSCYLYELDVTDLTFTYNYNVARIAAHAQLIEDMPDDVQSNAYPNTIYIDNLTAHFDSLIDGDACNLLVITFNAILWGTVGSSFSVVEYARTRPAVKFLARASGTLPVNPPTNFAYYTVSNAQGFFRAGAVAAKYAPDGSRIGYILPNVTRGWEVNAFIAGAAFVNRSSDVTIMVVSMDQDPSIPSEKQAIDLLLQSGCVAIFSSTLQNVLPLYLSAQPSVTAVSIGYGSDAALIAGDSVLTSVYIDLQYLFYNITRDAILGTFQSSYVAGSSNDVRLADISPKMNVALIGTADITTTYTDANLVWCIPFTDMSGVLHSGCVQETERNNFSYMDQRLDYMSAWQPPTACPAGTAFVYNPTTFAITCNACPPNTYSSVSGSSSCTTCEAGLVSPPGSTFCSTVSTSSFDLLLIIPIVVGACAAIVFATATTVALLRVGIAPSLDPRNAPPGPNVALAMIGVDGARSDRQWRLSLTNMCDVYDRLAGIITPIANNHKGYIFLSVGDVFMIAMHEPQQLVELLAAVQQEAALTSWPCTIQLKVALHWGSPIIGESSSRIVPGGGGDTRKTYSGPEIDTLRALWKRELVHADYHAVISERTLQFVKTEGRLDISQPQKFVQDSGMETMCVEARFLASTAAVRNMSAAGSAPTEQEMASNPLTAASQMDGETDSRRAPHTPSEASDLLDDDLARLVSPSAISKEELEALRSLGVDLLQKFIRVFSFDDQVTIVTAVAKKLHVQTPRIPEMKTVAKKSFNVLRNSLRQICHQLLMSMDEMELHSWLESVAAQVQEREGGTVSRNEDDAPAARVAPPS